MKQRLKKIRPPARQHFAIPMSIVLACVAGILGALVVLVSNLASTSVPATLKPIVPYAWYILGALLLLGIAVAIWDAWYSHRQSLLHATTPASSPLTSTTSMGVPSSTAQSASTPANTPATLTQPSFTLAAAPATSSPPASGSSLYHSCVLSYATEDEHFVKKLYNDLQAQGVPCWLAEQDIKQGDKLREDIYRAIRQQDKLLLVLSQHAIESKWVEEEVDVALDREHEQVGALLLFPIRLDETVFTTEKYWAITVRQRRIGDFRQWQDDVAYQQELQRLLRNLQS